MALKSISKIKYLDDSTCSIGGAKNLTPIEYKILKAPCAPNQNISLLQQAFNNIDQLEQLQKQLHFLVADVKSIVIKN